MRLSSTNETLLEKSDSTKAWAVATCAYLAVVTIWLVFIWQQDRPYMWLGDRFLLMQRDHDIVIRFGIALTMKAVGWFVMFLLLFKYARLNDMMQNFAPPPRAVRFEQETETEMRLVSRNPEQPSRVIIAGQLISMRRWRRLHSTLSFYNWKFTRDILEEAGTFRSLSKNYPGIRDEFIRLGWVSGGYVTDLGKEKISADTPPTLD